MMLGTWRSIGLMVVISVVGSAQGFAREGFAPRAFPFKNGSEPNSVYDMRDYPDRVHVFEVYFYGCPYSHTNVPNVLELVDDFLLEPRVQFAYLGLDRVESYYPDWIHRHNPTIPVLQDLNLTVWNLMTPFPESNAVPQMWVLDCHGDLHGRVQDVGNYSEQDKETIRVAVQSALNVQCL